MPEGKFGIPRFSTLGPLSRQTKEEVRDKWDECPESGKPAEICKEIKFISLKILNEQGFVASCSTLSDINGGSCGVVADFIVQRVDGVRVMEIGDGDHLWILHNGIHYDAEVPTGVRDWRELPIFSRIDPDTVVDIVRLAPDDVKERVGSMDPQRPEDIVREVTDERPREL